MAALLLHHGCIVAVLSLLLLKLYALPRGRV
jgi:hypothetical protein